jgi:Arsenical resistance operon protein ArsD
MAPTLKIFDPALCCSTGVCGPAADPQLATVAADLDWLRRQGVAIERYNLSSEPAAFALHPVVRSALARGNQVLPLVLLDDRIVAEGLYPARETLAALVGLVLQPVTAAAQACCAPKPGAGGSSCC